MNAAFTETEWVSSVKSSDIHIRAISQQMPQPSITKIHLKITYPKFHSNFPGANELTENTCHAEGIIIPPVHQFYWLQWHHMSWIRCLKITSNLTICLTGYSDQQQINIKGPHYWSFVRGIHQWLVDSLHKGPVMQTEFPCHNFFMCIW